MTWISEMGDFRYLLDSNDLLIAAHTLALDLILVTDNVDEFARVPGLSLENWLAG